MKKTMMALFAAAAMMLTACGGGSNHGAPSVGGNYYTKSELAADFVATVNSYMAGYDLDLMKDYVVHDEGNYIVVYDWVTDSYDAYDLSWYNPGENIADYLYDYDAYFYYGLVYIGDNLYEDPYTGALFDRETMSLDSFAKETRKSDAYKQKVTASIKAQFGLSQQSSEDLAQAYLDLTSMPKSQISATYVDRVAKQAFGFSLSEVESEVMSGNFGAVDSALANASVKTGVSADALQDKLKEMFNVDLSLLK